MNLYQKLIYRIKLSVTIQFIFLLFFTYSPLMILNLSNKIYFFFILGIDLFAYISLILAYRGAFTFILIPSFISLISIFIIGIGIDYRQIDSSTLLFYSIAISTYLFYVINGLISYYRITRFSKEELHEFAEQMNIKSSFFVRFKIAIISFIVISLVSMIMFSVPTYIPTIILDIIIFTLVSLQIQILFNFFSKLYKKNKTKFFPTA